ncbi:hypothetical protein [Rudanella lutea]|uniref:hypothetical protein n=1 Tax=Rudanella lutea TaxID=451374 RepID=UPI0005C45178|nr:hypothetical protein [Rudanella lutea]
MKHVLYGLLLAFLSTLLAKAQSPHLPYNADYHHLIDRMEIRQGRWAEGFHSFTKPYTRQAVVQLTDSVLANLDYRLSSADRFNLAYLRNDSWEWVMPRTDTIPSDNGIIRNMQYGVGSSPGDSRRPFLKVFYKKKADFYSVQTPEFDLHVNPVINLSFDLDSSDPERTSTYANTRGVEVRGTIGKKLGFYSYFADNQVFYPKYVREYAQLYGKPDLSDANGFAPGEGFTKRFPAGGGLGADFISARGSFNFNLLKIINVQFGHDRNFFGNGFRSMFLSDNASPYLFLKLTTRFGKHIQYTNLFTELQNVELTSNEQLIPNKYSTMHHLSVNIGKHVNVGIFESIVYSRDRLEIGYMNPLILYRFVESYRGSADNSFAGIDAKANFLKHFMAYGQIMFDEFRINDLINNGGSWTNKYAVQLGLKYIDAFGVPNLDLQGEYNLARPYMYAHLGGQTNYTHYNQPLAHPLGGNFKEAIGIARYQYNKLFLTGIFRVAEYGADPPGRNYGSNITKNYETRFRTDGNFIGQGRTTITTFVDARASYMLRHNFFVEGRYAYRLQSSQFRPLEYTNQFASIGIRWNYAYRNLLF